MQGRLFSPSETIALRPYQNAAREAVYAHLRTKENNPCVVIPTGGGKTPVIASICRDAVTQWGGRVLVLAHVKELLQQAADKLHTMAPEIEVGVYSAGLNRRDCRQPVIVAGIQSVYKRACDLDAFDLIIPDEAHLIPPDGEGMYQQFLTDAKRVNPNLRVVGFTATPFRMKSGPICTPDGILNEICFEAGVRELIVDGYLSPLVSKNGQVKVDMAGVNIRAGEFVADEVEARFDVPELVQEACAEIVAYTAERKSVLLFCCGVEHARHVVEALGALGQECGLVTGETPAGERERLLAAHKSGRLKYLANIAVLTTGYDAPNIDTVVLLRPTNSPGLYYQMVGRGFRLHPDKRDCLVLDFGGNVLRHGPVDRIQVREAAPKRPRSDGESPAKECPECKSAISVGYSVCPDCGYEFPENERQAHDPQASTAGVLSGQVVLETREVSETLYAVHVKRNAPADAPRTLRVDYLFNGGLDYQSEWVCVEHPEGSFPRKNAEKWWAARSNSPYPLNADEAVAIAESGGLRQTLEITVRKITGEKFDRVIDHKLGDYPDGAGVVPSADDWGSWDDIPFF